jgi:membrane-associated PAP2 superfamily phosphatase
MPLQVSKYYGYITWFYILIIILFIMLIKSVTTDLWIRYSYSPFVCNFVLDHKVCGARYKRHETPTFLYIHFLCVVYVYLNTNSSRGLLGCDAVY